VRGRPGLFPTKAFAAGEIIFEAATATGWIKASGCAMQVAKEQLPNAQALTVLTVEAVETFRQPSVWVLAGQPSRDPWAVMRVVHAADPVAATVVADASQGVASLRFRAALDMSPFSCELVWDIAATQGSVAPAVQAAFPGAAAGAIVVAAAAAAADAAPAPATKAVAAPAKRRRSAEARSAQAQEAAASQGQAEGGNGDMEITRPEKKSTKRRRAASTEEEKEGEEK
jgi:hypothetical protein